MWVSSDTRGHNKVLKSQNIAVGHEPPPLVNYPGAERVKLD